MIAGMTGSKKTNAATVEKRQFVSFWVDGQLLGVPVNAVQEVLTAQHIARVPRTRREIAGLLNLRGQIVTAVDLRKSLGLPDRDSDKSYMNVVLRYQGDSYSLLVDEVGDVIEVDSASIVAVPRTLDQRWKKVTSGIIRLEGRLFIILEVTTVLGLH
ncbi:MAG: chemotaxis protein [Planctomyces sp.]|uniref:CheW protein n=1 Tax=Rubinisphaera brasiliensis (strain ATCC 49424 / DSM 5305 / JCM 21570 / IAM 15109 / NBRC 103401 / IFAM 1448) TaxID=756272 RepID=F0SL03_RUBBR|nr:chemotaxis protein CheW [Rubinisphaera brasiliensis]ADY59856.1 CheW protein [Rubinisphaera brasiliensis DSM 5305]MBB03843.1 chemotaxis protein [Planctomyces sp.]